jgi:hypothetical protein
MHPEIDTGQSEVNPRLLSRVKCKSSEETHWEREANPRSVISKCVGHGYFGFQCIANEIALVTYGVNRLRIARFFRYEHLAGHDAFLAAQQTEQYYYYPLTSRLFAAFQDAFYVWLITDTGEVLHLDLTNVKSLSKAFSECLEPKPPM